VFVTKMMVPFFVTGGINDVRQDHVFSVTFTSSYNVGSVACVNIIVHKKILIPYLFRNLCFVFILQLGV
jgi:hypothetical protein